MNISAKLTLRFSIIVASILILFSIAVYTFHATYRKEEFLSRLENRALTTGRLLVTVQEVDKNLLRIIDRNSIYAMPREKVLVFDKNNQVIYSSLEELNVEYSDELLNSIRAEKIIRRTVGELEQVGVLFHDNNEDYVIIASAYDRYGKSKLTNLRTILMSGLIVGIIIIILAGRWFAAQVIAPLAKLNEQVSSISAGNLDQRIEEGNQKDEIAQLAMNFNLMLKRLEKAFDMQKSFVSNASHELRTPLASIRSQLQVTLAKERSTDEYELVLHSLLDDINSFSALTTGLLTLAKSGMDKHKLPFQTLRIDEVLFAAQEELAKMHPEYYFQLDSENMPENEKDLIIIGNEQLLNNALMNFMDNSCKFSPDKTVTISLVCNGDMVEIRFEDKGVGIPADEQDKIFSPFYRAANVQGIAKGHGIGLSLCKRIIELHGGVIKLASDPNKGSVFSAILPIHQE